MRSAGRLVVLVLSLFVLLAGSPLWASQYATLVGAVYDQTGAPIPGAKVYLKNPLAGFSQSRVTNADGEYTFNSVAATNAEEGEYYLLSAEMAGFATSEERRITIAVGDARFVLPPIILAPLRAAAAPAPPQVAAPQATAPQPVQQAKQTQPPAPPPAAPPTATQAPVPPTQPEAVTVAPTLTLKATTPQPSEASTVPVELISNTLGGVVDGRAVRTLPLVGRDFIDLALLLPGTYPVEQGSILEGASLVVNGARPTANNFLLDGADDNDYTINQSLPFQIVEAMQEFRVQASTSPAEFGRNGGSQINTISRRGLNTVHGGLFEFHRNSALGADNFFSAYNGGTFDQYASLLQKFGTQGDPFSDPTLAALYNRRKPQVIQNQFGANLGGALKKDKLFGFFNWESFRVANPRPLFEAVPAISLRNSSGGLLDPTAVALYSLYPVPNVPKTAFTDPCALLSCALSANAFFVGESKNSSATDNFLGRVDWRTSDRDSMSFKYNIQRIDQVQGGTLPPTANYPGNGIDVNGRNQSFSYNWVRRLSDRASNEFRFGWNRFRLDALDQDRTIDPASLGPGFQNLNFHNRGLPTVFVGGSLSQVFSVASQYGGGSLLSTLGADLSAPSTRADNVWSWVDNLSYNRGRHNWKFGGEFRHIRLNTLNEALGRGVLTFFSAPLATTSLLSSGETQPVGLPDVGSIARVGSQFGGGFDRYFSTQSLDGFVQDQWRVRPNFTVNYGVRYEVNTAPVESRNRLVNFYPNILGPGQGGLVRAGDTMVWSSFVDSSGNPIPLGKASAAAPRAGFDTDKKNWGPRFGFAWDPWKNGKTAVRGGYAIFFDQQPLELSVNMLYNPPFVQQDFANRTTLFTLPADFTLGTTFGTLGSPGWERIPYSITMRDPHTRTPYAQQFNFSIQQQLGNKALFEVGYVGSISHKLGRLRDLAPCTLDIFFANPLDCVPEPVGNVDPSKNPFLFTSIINQENSSNANFHSLQVRLETRNFHGLQIQAHYEWAKSIDNASSLDPQSFLCLPPISNLLSSLNFINPQSFAEATNISPALSLRPVLPIITTRPRIPQDSANLQGERGLSDFDVRHRAVIDYIYDVPRWERAGRVGQGWQLAGITTLQSGQPYSVFDDFFGLPLRPNLLRPAPTNNNNPEKAIDNANPIGCTVVGVNGCSSTSAFAVNVVGPQGQFAPGNLGRNTFSGPGLVTFDFSVLKNTYLGAGERKNLQFRAEFFNLFNHTNFRQPFSQGGELFADFLSQLSNGSASDGLPCQRCIFYNPFFGQILQARPARVIQFALKFTF
jgi:hypothetical protein